MSRGAIGRRWEIEEKVVPETKKQYIFHLFFSFEYIQKHAGDCCMCQRKDPAQPKNLDSQTLDLEYEGESDVT